MSNYPTLVLDLDEEGVIEMFAQIGYPYYESQIKEHGINGEVLVHLDHEALKDVGIHSVGQRISILKAIYNLKVEQNVPVEEGHYIPPSDEMDQFIQQGTSLPSRELIGLLEQRDDRIRNLEIEVQRLHESMLILRDDGINKSTGKIRSSGRSPTTSLFPHPLSNASTLNPHSDHNRSASKTRPRTAETNGPESPRSPLDSPNQSQLLNESELVDSSRQNGFNLLPSGDYGAPFNSDSLSPTTPTATISREDSSNTFSHSTSSTPIASTSTLPTINSNSTSTINRLEKDARLERSGSSVTSSDNPYRSFRVTLEDPCYKVLPAALKKYKINDDWRQYALFICYGNTERCLSYDEKPLLLFQRLKEGNANPVFMLRHIKDIKSPIAVASAKHAARREKRGLNAGIGLDKPPVTNRDGSILVKNFKLNGKEKNEEEDGVKDGYCISIYPYLAEREDEFDVAVGDSFVIISKTKGWWVVHRDLNNDSELSQRKSAWVPAGCLLETNVPPLSLAEPSMLSSPTSINASNVPIQSNFIVSVSTPGIALMDYIRNGSDELEVKKGTSLRILKRYNHWSYAIKEESGERGWLPSWFVSRPKTSLNSPTTPTTTMLDRNRTGSIVRNNNDSL